MVFVPSYAPVNCELLTAAMTIVVFPFMRVLYRNSDPFVMWYVISVITSIYILLCGNKSQQDCIEIKVGEKKQIHVHIAVFNCTY